MRVPNRIILTSDRCLDLTLAKPLIIFTRCVVNRGEGLTTVDFSGGDAATAGAIGRSEGQREKRAIVDLLSFDSETELIADGVGKVPLHVSADATVVVHKEDGLVQKNTSVEEL
ncbi:hypothetical protein B296_00035908, partial [Ensete ventricosum]